MFSASSSTTTSFSFIFLVSTILPSSWNLNHFCPVGLIMAERGRSRLSGLSGGPQRGRGRTRARLLVSRRNYTPRRNTQYSSLGNLFGHGNSLQHRRRTAPHSSLTNLPITSPHHSSAEDSSQQNSSTQSVNSWNHSNSSSTPSSTQSGSTNRTRTSSGRVLSNLRQFADIDQEESTRAEPANQSTYPCTDSDGLQSDRLSGGDTQSGSFFGDDERDDVLVDHDGQLDYTGTQTEELDNRVQPVHEQSVLVQQENQMDYPCTKTKDLHNSNNSVPRDQATDHGAVQDVQSDANFADTEFLPETVHFPHGAPVSSRRKKKMFQSTEQLVEDMGATEPDPFKSRKCCILSDERPEHESDDDVVADLFVNADGRHLTRGGCSGDGNSTDDVQPPLQQIILDLGDVGSYSKREPQRLLKVRDNMILKWKKSVAKLRGDVLRSQEEIEQLFFDLLDQVGISEEAAIRNGQIIISWVIISLLF